RQLGLAGRSAATEGHRRAGERGPPGERSAVGGAPLPGGEGRALVASLRGVDGPVRPLPPSIAMAVATAAEALSRVRRGSPRICRELARTLVHGHAYDGSKAARTLGLRYTPVEDTLRRTAGSWVEPGLV